jgi:hypothetical protein
MARNELLILFMSHDHYKRCHQLPFAIHEWCFNEIFETNLFPQISFLSRSILFCPVHLLSNSNLTHACKALVTIPKSFKAQ